MKILVNREFFIYNSPLDYSLLHFFDIFIDFDSLQTPITKVSRGRLPSCLDIVRLEARKVCLNVTCQSDCLSNLSGSSAGQFPDRFAAGFPAATIFKELVF